MSLKNKKLVRTVQVILGLGLLFFGLNGFFQFAPPPTFNEAGSALLGALFATGYFFPIMAIIWILAGLMFLFNRYSALAALILLPISINILLFHIILDFSGATIGILVFILNIYMLYVHWDNYKPICGK
jgi:putative oxidoreductase